MADSFKFRQTPIAAFLATLRIPAKQAQSNQETKKPMNACQDIHKDEKARQIIQKITVEDEETIRIHFRDSEMVIEQE